jgi:hypothetical protein
MQSQQSQCEWTVHLTGSQSQAARQCALILSPKGIWELDEEREQRV